MTARGVCRLVLWQHYDMIILLAYRRYSLSRQKNSILIKEHALNREPVPLRVRSVTQTSILVGIRRLRLLWLKKKIVLPFRLSFFVMKAHVNNSYIRNIHRQHNINCDKTCWVFTRKIIIISLVKKSLDAQGRKLSQNKKKEPRQKFSGTAERALGMLLLTKQFKDLFECK